MVQTQWGNVEVAAYIVASVPDMWNETSCFFEIWRSMLMLSSRIGCTGPSTPANIVECGHGTADDAGPVSTTSNKKRACREQSDIGVVQAVTCTAPETGQHQAQVTNTAEVLHVLPALGDELLVPIIADHVDAVAA